MNLKKKLNTTSTGVSRTDVALCSIGSGYSDTSRMSLRNADSLTTQKNTYSNLRVNVNETNPDVPSPSVEFKKLHYRYTEDSNRISSSEAGARRELQKNFSFGSSIIKDYLADVALKAQAELKLRNSLCERRVLALTHSIKMDEPSMRTAIIIKEERVRSALVRLCSMEGGVKYNQEKIKALVLMEQKQRLLRLIYQEEKEWNVISTLVETDMNLVRCSINPFGSCPFRGNVRDNKLGIFTDECPFKPPYGCHGQVISPEHFRQQLKSDIR